ncbi:MAG TPA: AAA family ATPase [Kofleriaceae bacterium]|nr:AAA family ATPase [Kofleriaceae bacterium]
MKLPRSCCFLFGPRGTGKSTWIDAALPDALHVDLLDQATFTELTGHADRLGAMADARGAKVIVIDEVQKLPALLDEVHRLIETRRLRFVLTGSSARKLRRTGTNLLAGRARTIEMHPFTATELGARWDLAHAIRYGMLPTVWVDDDPHEYLRSYVGSYLREEVQQEALVRNLASFSRFMEAASFSQGASLNMQAVAADCGISRKTVESHFELLEDLLLAVRIPVFQRRAKRKVTSHPKFFFFDAGVFRAIRPRGALDSAQEIDGAAIETLLVQSLRAENANAGLGYQMSFWRTPAGDEVDVVMYGEHGLLAFEITRSPVFRETDLRGLRLFCGDYPEATGFLLYGGTRRYQYDRISVLPFGEAIAGLASLLADGRPPPGYTGTPSK